MDSILKLKDFDMGMIKILAKSTAFYEAGNAIDSMYRRITFFYGKENFLIFVTRASLKRAAVKVAVAN